MTCSGVWYSRHVMECGLVDLQRGRIVWYSRLVEKCGTVELKWSVVQRICKLQLSVLQWTCRGVGYSGLLVVTGVWYRGLVVEYGIMNLQRSVVQLTCSGVWNSELVEECGTAQLTSSGVQYSSGVWLERKSFLLQPYCHPHRQNYYRALHCGCKGGCKTRLRSCLKHGIHCGPGCTNCLENCENRDS